MSCLKRLRHGAKVTGVPLPHSGDQAVVARDGTAAVLGAAAAGEGHVAALCCLAGGVVICHLIVNLDVSCGHPQLVIQHYCTWRVMVLIIAHKQMETHTLWGGSYCPTGKIYLLQLGSHE